MQLLHRIRLLQKTCPHCGKVNHLAVIDLFRSFYLRDEAENSVARHWCHHCHKGWDVDGFFMCQFLLYIVVIAGIAWRSDDVARILSPSPSESWMVYGITMVAYLVAVLFLDFYAKTYLVKILPLSKQT